MEVLEHLDNPLKALKELSRVSNKWTIISVPNEPIFRIMNIIRMKYLCNLGNTPGHVNNWNKKNFENFLNQRFNIILSKNVIIWNIFFCELKKND